MKLNRKELAILIILSLADEPLFGLQIVKLSKHFRPISRSSVYIRLTILVDAKYVYRSEGCINSTWRPTFSITDDGRAYLWSLFQENN